MFDEELSELKDRISQMPDRELLRIVEVEYNDYRKEALEFAEEELQKRSIPFEKFEPDEDAVEETDSPDPIRNIAPCRDCGGVMRSGLLFADKELTMLFNDDNEERFVQAFACMACGAVRLAIDLDTEVEP
ncbi:MAG TPA: hypothetical protein VN937_06155 [Blastocatellia bacterium]|nr:hypothetical protein [Blastocatellia bacterium]